MLKTALFDITGINSGPGRVEAVLEIDPTHEIFQRHFPGQPVVPGVCMIQIVKEVMEKALGCKLSMSGAGYLKFLAVLDPRRNLVVNAELKYSTESDHTIDLIATLSNEGITYFKMKGIFSRFIDQH